MRLFLLGGLVFGLLICIWGAARSLLKYHDSLDKRENDLNEKAANLLNEQKEDKLDIKGD
jgi:hypothetical protein